MPITYTESLRREVAERESDLCRRYGVALCPGCGAALVPGDTCPECDPHDHDDAEEA